jgi:hypothetical protein
MSSTYNFIAMKSYVGPIAAYIIRDALRCLTPSTVHFQFIPNGALQFIMGLLAVCIYQFYDKCYCLTGTLGQLPNQQSVDVCCGCVVRSG